MPVRSLLAVTLWLAATAPVLAQTATPPRASDPCAPGRATVGEGQDLKAPNAKNDKSLSDHLAQTGGVICPPANVDPEIKAPTPQGGRMPVIPPPGSPGGDPHVQPK